MHKPRHLCTEPELNVPLYDLLRASMRATLRVPLHSSPSSQQRTRPEGYSRPKGSYLLEDVFKYQVGSSHLVLSSGVPLQRGSPAITSQFHTLILTGHCCEESRSQGQEKEGESGRWCLQKALRRHGQSTEYYSAINKNELVIPPTTRVNLRQLCQAKTKSLCAAWFHVRDTLEMSKLQKWRTD